MKRLFVGAAMMLLLLLPLNGWAANAVEMGSGFIHVTLDGATDFVWTTDTITTGLNIGKSLTTLFPYGLKLFAIVYKPPAAAAGGYAQDKTTTGTVIPPKFLSVDGSTQALYLPGTIWYKPCLTNANQTTPTAAEWWFIFTN